MRDRLRDRQNETCRKTVEGVKGGDKEKRPNLSSLTPAKPTYHARSEEAICC